MKCVGMTQYKKIKTSCTDHSQICETTLRIRSEVSPSTWLRTVESLSLFQDSVLVGDNQLPKVGGEDLILRCRKSARPVDANKKIYVQGERNWGDPDLRCIRVQLESNWSGS